MLSGSTNICSVRKGTGEITSFWKWCPELQVS